MSSPRSAALTPGKGHGAVRCLLCRRDGAEVVERIPVAQVSSRWHRRLGIDILEGAWRGRETVERFACPHCGFVFFPPELAGSDSLYARLQRTPDYYVERKWEHDEALRDIPDGARVLEVGCATGSFVGRMRREHGLDASGIELNDDAIEVARAARLPVRRAFVEEIATQEPASYDVVCSFQVLEHVPDPAAFLKANQALLRPGGLLIIGVPNSGSYLRHGVHMLDAPPHHISRWSAACVANLAGLFGMTLVRVAEEPLPAYHVLAYIRAEAEARGRRGLGWLANNPVVWLLGTAWLRLTGRYRTRQGQTLYACFRSG